MANNQSTPHSFRQRNFFSFAKIQLIESVDICSENDREWSDFSIYLALPLEHCLSSVAASLREAAYISVCRKIVGTNVFTEHISTDSISVCPQLFQKHTFCQLIIISSLHSKVYQYKKRMSTSFHYKLTFFTSTSISLYLTLLIFSLSRHFFKIRGWMFT